MMYSAGRSTSGIFDQVDAEAQDSEDVERFQTFRGELQGFEFFTCSRDNTEENICQVLAPVTAPFSVRLALDQSDDATDAVLDDWLTAQLDVNAIQLHISKQGLSTLVKIGTASVQTVKKRQFSQSSWAFASSAGSTREGVKAKIDRKRKSKKAKLEREKSRDLEDSRGSSIAEGGPRSRTPSPPEAVGGGGLARLQKVAGSPGMADRTLLVSPGGSPTRLSMAQRLRASQAQSTNSSAKGPAIFNGTLKIGLIQMSVDLTDDTGTCLHKS